MSVHTPKWRKVRAQVLREESSCWLCGLPIDFDAAPRSSWAPSVDHVVPRSKGGDPYDRANLRACHVGCNSGRRERDPKPDRKSRRW